MPETPSPLITLTTDFGNGSHYVAQMKAVLLDAIPEVRIVDVTHAIGPQKLIEAAVVLADTLKWFPSNSIHIAVIDPGVGTERPVLLAKSACGYVIGPDNGIFSLLELSHSVVLDRPESWAGQPSQTFHGRDIMAPVAAALAQDPQRNLVRFGTPSSTRHHLNLRQPVQRDGSWFGQVLFADSFGNLITNLSDDEAVDGTIEVAGEKIPKVGCYGQANPGDMIALIGSSGRLEIAIVNGSAAAHLGQDPAVMVRYGP
ncbi:MAG: SAM-dependent chlorinase/fluorinase [Planctomycetota bacterium]